MTSNASVTGDRPIDWVRVALAFGLGLVLMVWSGINTAGGHGSYLLAKAFFPYTMLAIVPSGGKMALVGVCVAAAQMPAYTFIADLPPNRKTRIGSVVGLIILHAGAVASALALNHSYPHYW